MEQYQKIIGQDNEAMKKVLEPMALRRVKTSLCLEAVANEEKVEVTDEEIDSQYEDMAKLYGIDIEEVKKYVSRQSVKDDLKLSKAIDILKNSNKE